VGREERAAEFERALLALLAHLERSSEACELGTAAERCRRAFTSLCAESGASEAAAMERVRRAFALVRRATRRELDATEKRLRLARAARRAFACQTDAAEGTGSCDLAG